MDSRFDTPFDPSIFTDCDAVDPCPSPAPLSDWLPVDAGDPIWRDEFLALGGNLRIIYGNQMTLDEALKAYVISFSAGIAIRVTCSGSGLSGNTVRFASPIIEITQETTGLWQFAMRENARLQLARLSFDEGVLWVDYEIPADFAYGRPLQIAATAVGSAALTLINEFSNLSAEAA